SPFYTKKQKVSDLERLLFLQFIGKVCVKASDFKCLVWFFGKNCDYKGISTTSAETVDVFNVVLKRRIAFFCLSAALLLLPSYMPFNRYDLTEERFRKFKWNYWRGKVKDS
ncbi:MAG: hypothetical protein ACQES4_10735, partial [Bacillota bacterium]